MIKIQGLRLKPGEPESKLTGKAQKELGTHIEGFRVLKRSLDARKKDDIAYVYTIAVELPKEAQFLKHCRSKRVSAYEPKEYAFPCQHLRLGKQPVIVGAGPAGLFCGLMLARIGARPIILERGCDVDTRKQAVDEFWQTGKLSPRTNVQFGEGGAGTFSDGKLNTGINNPRLGFILREFVNAGAPSDILYEAAPHIGTDYLCGAVKHIRNEIIELGGEVRFGSQLTGITSADGMVTAVTVSNGENVYQIATNQLVLAIGHSARDTFEMLYNSGVYLEQKPFAVGVRIEHKQKKISESQYGAAAEKLPAATYKLAYHAQNGHTAFSFCVCPGGMVVAAASEEGNLCTNGMSNHARDEENINGGLLVTVTTDDFPSEHPLAGIALQRKLEQDAFVLGGSDYHAPCQRVGDFLDNTPSDGPGTVQPSYRPGVKWANLQECLPTFVSDTLQEAIPELGKKLHGFDDPDALLTAVESRSSSPVRITRGENGQSLKLKGLYPCGEGAGYAGGIMSAAADGIRTAELICAEV